MTLLLLIAIVCLHFVADFVLQSDRVANGKSRDVQLLAYHATLYGLCFLVLLGGAFVSIEVAFGYAVINAVLHFLVDAVSSRLTSHFWQREQRHWLFVTIGADQAIHVTLLVLTAFGSMPCRLIGN